MGSATGGAAPCKRPLPLLLPTPKGPELGAYLVLIVHDHQVAQAQRSEELEDPWKGGLLQPEPRPVRWREPGMEASSVHPTPFLQQPVATQRWALSLEPAAPAARRASLGPEARCPSSPLPRMAIACPLGKATVRSRPLHLWHGVWRGVHELAQVHHALALILGDVDGLDGGEAGVGVPEVLQLQPPLPQRQAGPFHKDLQGNGKHSWGAAHLAQARGSRLLPLIMALSSPEGLARAAGQEGPSLPQHLSFPSPASSCCTHRPDPPLPRSGAHLPCASGAQSAESAGSGLAAPLSATREAFLVTAEIGVVPTPTMGRSGEKGGPSWPNPPQMLDAMWC